MARLFTAGAESKHAESEGMTSSGTVGFNTTNPRTGAAAFEATATNSFYQRVWAGVTARTYYIRGYYRFPTNPTGLHRPLLFLTTGGSIFLALELVNTSRVFRLIDSGGTTLATGTIALSNSTYYRVEVSINIAASGNSAVELRINGVTDISGSFALGNTAPGQARFGFAGNLGGLASIQWDDIAINDDQGSDQNTWCGQGSVWLLLPASDPATGTSNANWTKPGGSTSTRNTAVDNVPPVFLADSTSSADAEKMLRNPTNAASQLELDITDYTTAGIPSTDKIVLVTPVAVTGSSSATDTTGDFGVLSNPTGSQKAMTTFDNGIASSTATTWPCFFADPVYTPTVTRGTKPRVRLSRAAANRTVMTNMVGLVVETVPLKTGAADLTGTGSLSATARGNVTGAAALTGTGSLSATAKSTRFAAAALTGTGTSSVQAATKITLTNPSFETNLTGWSQDAFVSTTLTRVTTWASEGAASAELAFSDTNTGHGNGWRTPTGTGGFSIPVGADVHGRIDFKPVVVSAPGAHIRVSFYDAGGGSLGGYNSGDLTAEGTLEAGGPVAGAAFVTIGFYGNVNGSFDGYFDNARLYIVGAFATRSGAVALTGTGSLTAAGTRIVTGAAALTGTGTLSATSGTAVTGAAALTGNGTLTSNGTRVRFGAADLTGTGSSTVAGYGIHTAAAALTGTGSSTAAGYVTHSAAAALTGTGSLTAAGTVTRSASASLTGAGTLSATGTHAGVASAALTGAGTLSATATHTGVGVAALTGAGTLSASAAHTGVGAAALTGTGTLSATATRTVTGSAALAGTGSLSATGAHTGVGAADLTGTGTLTAIPAGASATAHLTGTGTLTATATRITYATAALTGTGTLAASATRTVAGQTSLQGAGTLTATATHIGVGAAHLTGLGTSTAAGHSIHYDAADLIGTGTLTATGGLLFAGAADLTGLGTLTATGLGIAPGSPATGRIDLAAIGVLTEPEAGIAERAARGRMTPAGRGRLPQTTKGAP